MPYNIGSTTHQQHDLINTNIPPVMAQPQLSQPQQQQQQHQVTNYQQTVYENIPKDLKLPAPPTPPRKS